MLWLFLFVLNFSYGESTINPTALYGEDGSEIPEEDVNSQDVAWSLLKGSDPRNETWKSVGMIRNDSGGTCTATLIEPPNCQRDISDMKPLVLTNGHCSNDNPDEEPALRGQSILFNRFVDQKDKEISIRKEKTLYTSQKAFDLAFLELSSTYGDLKKKGVLPKKIAKSSMSGTLANVGVPSSGIDKGKTYLRKSYCPAGEPVKLMEGSWVWNHQRSITCSVTGGSSGSGLFNEKGELAGLVNTAVHSSRRGERPCALNNPCEIQSGQPQMKRRNYGFDTRFLHKCFTDCKLDIKKKGCLLPNDPEMVSSQWGSFNNDPKNRPLDLKHSQYQSFRGKICLVSDTQCRCDQPQGYRNVQGTDSLNALAGKNVPDGSYRVCVLGGHGHSWQDLKDATEMPLVVDTEKPVFEAQIKKSGDQTELLLSDRSFHYSVKTVESDSDCYASMRNWVPVLGYKPNGAAAFNSFLERKLNYNMPRLCVRATDEAGNIKITALKI
ncbi:MAG: trypsin-like peptidase domain-containing protein [Bdellovibrionales bacterium]|nr:trypsin-like peptidase domain-containing protein [Bdellovibrionales bacterium]